MKLSVVVCSYNQCQFVRETLDSLVNQQNLAPGELEIIVIDGASTDGSAKVIEGYRDHLRYFVSEPDRGQTHALNKGFAKATGEILCWVCSDDMLSPNAARFVLDYFASHPTVDFIYGDAKIVGSAGEVQWFKREIPFNWFIWAYGFHNYIPQTSAFWTRRLHERVNGLDERFDFAMDADLWARFAQETKPQHVRKVLSTIRTYSETKSIRGLSEANREWANVCRRYGVDHCLPHVRALKYVAKACRLTWKIASGCYVRVAAS